MMMRGQRSSLSRLWNLYCTRGKETKGDDYSLTLALTCKYGKVKFPARQQQLSAGRAGGRAWSAAGTGTGRRDWMGMETNGDGDGGGLDPLAELRAGPPCWARS